MKKIILILSILVTITSGCGNNKKFIKKEPSEYKIMLILPGPINDEGWNSKNYLASRLANEKLGTKIEYIENIKKQDFENKLQKYGELEYDLILVAGYQFEESVTTIAPKYPNSLFTIINGIRAEEKNIAAIFPKEYEASFIASIVAGNITENGKFGTIGDFSKDHVEKILDIFEMNSIKIAESRGIDNPSVIRTYSNSWNDIELGRLIAEQMINDGVDTIFTYSHDLEIGAMEIANKKGAKIIGFSHNLTELMPETALASINLDFNQVYTWTIEQFLNGKLNGKEIHEIGIKEGIFQEYFSDYLDQRVIDEVNRKIKDYKSK